MSDARSLLRAKRTEARISHPLAQYTASGQLRCIACQAIVKQSAQWAGHVGSKAHRVSVSRAKEEERKRLEREEHEHEQEQQALSLKRKAEEEHGDGDENMTEGHQDSKRRRVSEEATPNGGGFPADFFSDPSQAPVLLSHEDDSDQEMDSIDPQTSAAPTEKKSAIDLEFEQFQKEIATTVASADDEDKHDTYNRATLSVDAVMASEVPEGFPPAYNDSSSKEKQQQQPTSSAPVDSQSTEPTEEENRQVMTEESRKQKERDERELIMDRLMDEERVQEEADEKVKALKDRVDAFKKRRAAAALSKSKKK